jgi:signal peptidase
MTEKKFGTKQVVSIVLDVILVLMILYIGATLYLRSTTGNPYASIFGITTHVVISGSMEPSIHEGDIVIVKQLDNYEIGDVIVYIRDDGLSITHRIIDIGIDGYVTKGDANQQHDPGAAKINQIVGKVIHIFSNTDKTKSDAGASLFLIYLYFRIRQHHDLWCRALRLRCMWGSAQEQ